MRLGNLNLSGRVLAAPLAGVSSRPYRVLARRGGAALVFTEMISADGLVRDNEKTLAMVTFADSERPIGVQLFGADPVVMGEAAAILRERYRPEVIDINFGCPVRKVVGRNGGAAVLKDMALAGRIMEAVVKGAGRDVSGERTSSPFDYAQGDGEGRGQGDSKGIPQQAVGDPGSTGIPQQAVGNPDSKGIPQQAVGDPASSGIPQQAVGYSFSDSGQRAIPVMVKIRTGWDEVGPVYLEVGEIARSVGVAGITLHARSRSRGYAGKADWEAIADLKRSLTDSGESEDSQRLVVIGNGDVTGPEAGRRMIDETGCDGIMIGRASLGDPGIFGRVERYLATGERISEPSAAEKIGWALEHAELMAGDFGEKRGMLMMRKFLGWYVKGMPGVTHLRGRLFKVHTIAEARDVLAEYVGG